METSYSYPTMTNLHSQHLRRCHAENTRNVGFNVGKSSPQPYSDSVRKVYQRRSSYHKSFPQADAEQTAVKQQEHE